MVGEACRPAPRTTDGEVDLTGVWQVADERRLRFAGTVANPTLLTQAD